MTIDVGPQHHDIPVYQLEECVFKVLTTMSSLLSCLSSFGPQKFVKDERVVQHSDPHHICLLTQM